MRTNLHYFVDKQEDYNFDSKKHEIHIVGRGYYFFVTGAKTEEEHNSVVTQFSKYLEKNGVHSDGFGSGSWEDALRRGSECQKDFCYLLISVDDIEKKYEVKKLYDDWKRMNRKLNLERTMTNE